MATRKLQIVNRSSYEPPDGRATIVAIGQAIAIQLRDVAAAWGQVVWDVVGDASSRGFRIVLLDNEAHGADLGFHDVDKEGRPYARVFLDPLLRHGGHWLDGSLSVAATVSHEACELVVDPAANRWAESATGSLWALELCDPVEEDVYTVEARDGTPVTVSDFVFPAWFNPLAPESARFDQMGRVHRPFEIRPGGYGIRFSNGTTRSVYGREYPAWRRKTKQTCGSRTWTRHRYGRRCRTGAKR